MSKKQRELRGIPTTLRQSRALRGMFRLGSFTVAQLVNLLGENERYIQNLICGPESVIKKRRLLVRVDAANVRGRVGAPAKIWAVDPAKQLQLLEMIDAHYPELQLESVAEKKQMEQSADQEELVFSFMNMNEMDSLPSSSICGARIGFHEQTEELSKPVVTSLERLTEAPTLPIFLTTEKVAEGLAAFCKPSDKAGSDVTVVVHLRAGAVHFAFIRQREVRFTFRTELEMIEDEDAGMGITLGHKAKEGLFGQLMKALDLYEVSYPGETVKKVLIAGNISSPNSLCLDLESVTKMSCTFLDPLKSVSFSSALGDEEEMRELVMKLVPEIGYAVRSCEIDRKREFSYSSLIGRARKLSRVDDRAQFRRATELLFYGDEVTVEPRRHLAGQIGLDTYNPAKVFIPTALLKPTGRTTVRAPNLSGAKKIP